MVLFSITVGKYALHNMDLFVEKHVCIYFENPPAFIDLTHH